MILNKGMVYQFHAILLLCVYLVLPVKGWAAEVKWLVDPAFSGEELQ